MEKEINITYETLFDLLRREKGREELQELGEGFFNDVAEYLQAKREIAEKGHLDVFDRKIDVQLQNIRKILRELYERRERKIMNMALTSSRTGAELPGVKLSEPETGLYSDIKGVLDRHRQQILGSLLCADAARAHPDKPAEDKTKPAGEQAAWFKVKPEGEQARLAVNKAEPAGDEAKQAGDSRTPAGAKAEWDAQQPRPAVSGQRSGPGSPCTESPDRITVRFLHPVPRFVGRELEAYGPFDCGHTAELPSEIAELLIRKNAAEPDKPHSAIVT